MYDFGKYEMEILDLKNPPIFQAREQRLPVDYGGDASSLGNPNVGMQRIDTADMASTVYAPYH